MIDHLIFNRLKWINIADNANSVNANGKNWQAIPKSLTVSAGAYLFKYPVIYGNEWDYSSNGDDPLPNDETFDCLGVENWGNLGRMYMIYNRKHGYTHVSESLVKNVIWGGKRPLSHVCQWFRHVFTSRNEVRACM